MTLSFFHQAWVGFRYGLVVTPGPRPFKLGNKKGHTIATINKKEAKAWGIVGIIMGKFLIVFDF